MDIENLSVEEAAEAKIKFAAAREKAKMISDQVKSGAALGNFVDRAEAEYWLSFMQRGVNDTLSAVKRVMPEAKRFYLAGDDIAAGKVITGALAAAWKGCMRDLQDALDGADRD
ncbi:MAG: hypothetical protein LBD37_09485 [Treponema sp.]|jgi:hypothetical protein|nr:hypothetical protein [Treponema sp.]